MWKMYVIDKDGVNYPVVLKEGEYITYYSGETPTELNYTQVLEGLRILSNDYGRFLNGFRLDIVRDFT